MAFTVGISTCLDHRGRWREGRDYVYLDRRYGDALAAAGADPLLLPPGARPERAVAAIDALVLPGGDDFEPDSPYPAEIPFELASPDLVAFDRALLAAARQRALPILGICYGAQLMALEAGGGLHHHIPLDLPAAREHQLPEPLGRHAIEIDDDSRLASLLGTRRTDVNSLHHQCIAAVGPGMRPCARAEDGVIEAIESLGPTLEIGVQWHPEKMSGPAGDAFLAAWVGACRTP